MNIYELANIAIKDASSKFDECILFHSATGKDSIALLNMLAPKFKKVYCVFMYTVKGLDHIGRYINWAKKTYSNIEFIETPHYAVYSYIKSGHLGIKKNEKQKQYTLAEIDEFIRLKTGCNVSFYGFKQSDSLNRRLMLRTYREQTICDKSAKYYPLSNWKNGDVLKYIQDNQLIEPIKYGNGQSQGANINDMDFLLWCKNNFPNDLKRIIEVYPEVDILIYQHEHKAERNGCN